MNEQQKERIFELLKEIKAVAKEADPKIVFINLCFNENYSENKRCYRFFGLREGNKESTVDACRFEEKEKDAADQS